MSDMKYNSLLNNTALFRFPYIFYILGVIILEKFLQRLLLIALLILAFCKKKMGKNNEIHVSEESIRKLG